MTCKARFHRGGNAQGSMHAAEVVVHEIERHGCRVIFHFLAESVSEPGESANPHPHAEIRPLDKASRDMVWVGMAHDWLSLTGSAHGRAIPCFLL